ncbi:HEAT repeat domain-containing protein [Spirulina sp. CCNP1310]|uniref:HEAT repeat domain-containing protein n=1 Tax=Spirulina sp. CCNP1310 TaxID=3110249 RepID=UPI002B21C1C7|nr:HEAT repeat domain-containing protein [Spirulina sp. CCNP1310]MEA5420529.1 HEAT repeat domain-containing protein [Spirulina sp. CCNP1310]
MEFIGGLVFGVAATAVVYTWRNRTGLERLENLHRQELNSLRQTMAQDYELQIKTAVESVKAGQQSHLASELNALSQEHQGAIAQLQREHQTALAALESRHQKALDAFQPVITAPIDQQPTPMASLPVEAIALASPPIQPTPLPIQTPSPAPATFAPGDLNAALAQPDPQERIAVATYLGELAAAAPHRAGSEPWLNHLGCLSQDPDSQVRQTALLGLSQVKSDRVIPWLTQSLKDQDPAVVQTAAAALNQFKFYTPVKNRPLPKNAAPQD